jgi:hypothetical protein
MDRDGKNDIIGCGDDERGYLASWKGNTTVGSRSGACSRSGSRSASKNYGVGDKRTSMRKSALRVVHSGKIKELLYRQILCAFACLILFRYDAYAYTYMTNIGRDTVFTP